MTVSTNVSERTRAWILVQVDSPHDAAQTLYDTLWEEGDDNYVVIRADVVDYVYNVVIPVDAANPVALEAARQRILEITGATQIVVIPVVHLVPSVPHNAHGFITAAEARAGHERVDRPGRQHWSPGANPWG